MTIPLTDSFRPLRVSISLWHPEGSTLRAPNVTVQANPATAAGANPSYLFKDDVRKIGDTKYFLYSGLDLTQYFIRFQSTSTVAGLWQGEITFFDSSDSGLEVISIIDTLQCDNVLDIQFGNDDATFDQCPHYVGYVAHSKYDLQPNGVMITLTMSMAQTVSDIKLHGNQVKPDLIFQPDMPPVSCFLWLARSAGWLSFNELVAVGGWRNALNGDTVTALANSGKMFVEESQTNQRYRPIGITLQPDASGETYYSYAKRLAEASVTSYGMPFKFYVTSNQDGSASYHFHSESYLTPGRGSIKFVYGDPDTGVISAHVEAAHLYASLKCAVNATFYYSEVPGGTADIGSSKPGLGDNGQFTVSQSKLEGSTVLDLNAGDSALNTISTDKVVYTIKASNVNAAYSVAAHILQEGRWGMFPLDLTVVGRHDLEVFSIVRFDYSPRGGAKGFISGNYRVLSVTHQFDTSGWVTVVNAFRDSVDSDAPVIKAPRPLMDEAAILAMEKRGAAAVTKFKTDGLASIYKVPDKVTVAVRSLVAGTYGVAPPTADQVAEAALPPGAMTPAPSPSTGPPPAFKVMTTPLQVVGPDGEPTIIPSGAG